MSASLEQKATQANNTLAADTCPIAATLSIVGEKWTLLILRDIFRGLSKFNELEASLGCPRNLLSARLKKLQESGLIHTEVYAESGQRSRKRYVLTESGLEIIPVLGALQTWGLQHFQGTTHASLLAHHQQCGAQVELQLVCEQGHAVDLSDLEFQ